MNEFITLICDSSYNSDGVLYVGQKVELIKDYENIYDEEAIRVEIDTIGTVGYVANSVKTVAKGTKSAGRIYDTFENITYGLIRFIVKDVAIVELETSIRGEDDLEGIYMNRDKSGKISIIELSIFNKEKNLD